MLFTSPKQYNTQQRKITINLFINMIQLNLNTHCTLKTMLKKKHSKNDLNNNTSQSGKGL
jgi:hypothetical protein